MGFHISPAALLFFPVILFSIICHEIAHAYVAYRGGDDTARLQGRLSFNPIVHIDPIGTILVPVILMLSPVRLPLIGWAKPVPVNPARLRSAKWGLAVSLAGVTVNFALALCAAILMKVFLVLGLDEKLTPLDQGLSVFTSIFIILNAFVMINLLLMLFNLLPIPPLDGSHVLLHFIRTRDSAAFRLFQFLERYGFIILILLVWIGALQAVLWPVLEVILVIFCLAFQIPRDAFIFI